MSQTIRPILAFAILAFTFPVGSFGADQTAQVMLKTIPIGASSMEPTFTKTDRIQINLNAYASEMPRRWDVVTYLNPSNGNYWTHRVIGLPGDEVVYDNEKRLFVNGREVVRQPYELSNSESDQEKFRTYIESTGSERHLIRLQSDLPPVAYSKPPTFPGASLCQISDGGFRCNVPPASYFVMGDNRDWSADSRYRGFIPAELIGGKVVNEPAVHGVR